MQELIFDLFLLGFKQTDLCFFFKSKHELVFILYYPL